MDKNYYDILGISKDASSNDIKAAYKKLARKYHPDMHVSDSDEDKKKAEEKFKDINEAYQTLSDPEKKAAYDNPHPNFEEFGGFGFDPFGMMGNRMRRDFHRPGRDILLNINLTLEELYNAKEKKKIYKKNVRCSECHGSGGEQETCSECGGTGVKIVEERRGNMFIQRQTQCSKCNGEGKIIKHKCKKCNGTGFDTVEKEFIINDLNRIDLSENNMRYDGGFGGHESSDPQGQDGRLILQINFEYDENRYQLNENGLYENVFIPYYDALLGTDKQINLPNGKDITIHIPECTKPNTIITSKGNGPRGKNYYAVIVITYPNKLSEVEKQNIMGIKESETVKN